MEAMLSRRGFLSSALGAATASGQFFRRPNVIHILADDLGWGDLGCYGNRFVSTPNIDKLAKSGTLFTQFYSANPVCSPSRTAWMTGQFPAHHRIHGHLATAELNAQRTMPNYLDPQVAFLPRLVREAGYATAHYGKWHLGSGEDAPPPGAYGLDHFKTVDAHDDSWAETQKDPWFRAKSTAMIVDEAIRFIESHKSKQFYANLWTLVPHATLNPTPEQMAPYDKFQAAGVDHKSARQIFYASVTDLDTQVGRLMAKLEELDLVKHTIVVFSSDNGPEEIQIRNAGHSGVGSPGPFRGRKRSLYEGGVRVPLIASWPGRIAARVNSASVVGAVDFLPTVARVTNAKIPKDWRLDGEEIVDALTGSTRPRRKPLYWEWRFAIAGPQLNQSPSLAIREGDYKFLVNRDGTRPELYNIPKDPMELNNLADRMPDIVKKLQEPLQAWHKTLPEGNWDASAGQNSYPWPA
jgi:N-acetylgalactosamine-6-sulfatase